MRPWPRRSRPEPPRPDPVRIAVLEYDLFGVQPKPGTMAAALIGLRQLNAVLSENPDDPDRRL